MGRLKGGGVYNGFRTEPYAVASDRIAINGKVYLAADKVLETIDKVSHKASARGEFWTAEKIIKILRRDVEDLILRI